MWDIGYGFDIFSNVLSDETVAPGAGPGQQPLLISQFNRNAVHFHFTGVFELLGTSQESFPQAVVKVIKFLCTLGVFQ